MEEEEEGVLLCAPPQSSQSLHSWALLMAGVYLLGPRDLPSGSTQ